MRRRGAVQLFTPLDSSEFIVGVVGTLQLDVLQSRLRNEYDVQAAFDAVELATARWYRSKSEVALAAFEDGMRRYIARDVRNRPVYLAESNWRLGHTLEKYPKIEFFETIDGLTS